MNRMLIDWIVIIIFIPLIISAQNKQTDEQKSAVDQTDTTGITKKNESNVLKKPGYFAATTEQSAVLNSTFENKEVVSSILDKTAPITISGFGDFYTKTGNRDDEEKKINVGQVEVDLSTTVSKLVGVEAAIAFDAATETFGLGTFTIDLPLFGVAEDHFYSISGVNHSGIIVGQFDVPFGIDWEVYPSIDRKLVTTPLIVDKTHECWNDYGFQIYAENDWFETILFGINGFGFCETPLNDTQLEIPSDISIGGRFALKQGTFLEVGSSYANIYLTDDSYKMYLWGVDAQLNFFDIELKGEYIKRGIRISGTDTKDYGYYGEFLYKYIDKFFIFRLGNYRSDYAEKENSKRLSTGIGWEIISGCEVRYEYQFIKDSKGSGYLQFAVGF